LEKNKKDIKNAELLADFDKVVKKCTKKVISKTSLTNMSKSEISVTVLLITFFSAFFQNFFSEFKISMKVCVFNTHVEFFIEKFFCSY
jgi:hypothetical protein